MSFFAELKGRNVIKVALASIHEQDGASMRHLHVAAQKRGFATLLRSQFARVGTSQCQGAMTT